MTNELNLKTRELRKEEKNNKRDENKDSHWDKTRVFDVSKFPK